MDQYVEPSSTTDLLNPSCDFINFSPFSSIYMKLAFNIKNLRYCVSKYFDY